MRLPGWLVLPFLFTTAMAQEPIRVDVHLINVAFSVLDTNGRFVTDLNQEDFDVAEDNVPQKISFFAPASETPLNLGLIMDFSGSQSEALRSHHKDLETFLKAVVTPRDRGFLLCFENRLRLVNDFTSKPKEILASLSDFEDDVRTRRKEKKGIKGAFGYPEIGPAEIRPLFSGTAFFDAAYESVNVKLRGEQHGRKALVIFSDGEDNSSARDELEVIEIAQANDSMLFCVRYTELRRDGMVNSRNKYGKTVMARIARDTGGADFDAHERELAANLKSIGDQLRSSYELAYHTTNPTSDGTFRKILIRCRRPGVTVRAKSGYIAN